MNDVVKKSLRGKVSNTTPKGVNQVLVILNTARDIFVKEGYSKLSMRGVASQAGVTLGAVQHYFKTKDAMVEAMLLRVLEEIQTIIDEIVSSRLNESALDQFKAIMEHMIDYVESADVRQTWFELGTLATRYDFAASTMEKLFTTARKEARALIRPIMPHLDEHELELRAALVLEVLMGIMFVAGKSRFRSKELAGVEQKSLQTIVDIVVRED